MEAYLDNSATTKCAAEVVETAVKVMSEDYGNPSSKHMKGVDAEKYIREAKEIIAKTLKCQDKEILFTSGGTESNNMAIIGTAMANKRKGMHCIVSSVEHSSVKEPFNFLEKEGFRITYLPVDKDGIVDIEALKDALDDETILVSVMYVNNEIGAVEPIEEIGHIIKDYNPDIVYAHSSKAGAITRIADIGLKNHCIYNPHGWAFNMRCTAKKKAMYTAIEKIAAPFCEKIICISDAEKQSALDKKICREEKLQVIFNGVDIESYENGVRGAIKRKDLNIPEDAFVVGMVGRISPQKAPDVFVKMAKQVKDEVPNAHFIIVGNGNQEDEIRKYAEDNGFSDNLHITGWVDNPMSYVELFDVACLLSRWEGFGLALPEYMMASKPIVASRVDAIPNIIKDGENGLLVEVDDDIGASEAVLRLYREDELRNRLVAQGMEDVHNRFNARRVSEEHGKLFERM